MRARTLRIFFDGGCRPNPGPMEVAVVLRGVAHVRTDLGHGSNSDAEWLALIEAARLALAAGERDVTFLGDSTLVVGQASGRAKCRGAGLQAHLASWAGLVPCFDRVRVRYIRRAQNLAGIALDRRHGRA